MSKFALICFLLLCSALSSQENLSSEFEGQLKKTLLFHGKKDWKNFLPEIEMLRKISVSEKEKNIALSLNAAYYMDQKEFGKAIPYYEEILKIDEKDTDALDALGFIYQFGTDLETKVKKSLPYYLKAEKSGSERAETYYGISCIYSLQKETEKSVEYLDKAIYHNYEDIEHLINDTDLENIRHTEYFIRLTENWDQIQSARKEIEAGASAMTAGKTEDAIQKYSAARGTVLKLLGEKSLIASYIFIELGRAYAAKSDFKNAADFAERSLEIRRKILGLDHNETAASMEALRSYKAECSAGLHPKFKELENAFHIWKTESGKNEFDRSRLQKALNDVLNLEKEIYGETSSRTDSIRMNMKLFISLGKFSLFTGDSGKAESNLLKGCIIRERLFAKGKETAECLSLLGEVYKRQNRFDESARNLESALSTSLKVLEANHPDIASLYISLGNVYESNGNWDKAAEYYRKSLGILIKNNGEDHPRIADVYSGLARLYQFKGEYEKAILYFRSSLYIRAKKLGENHLYVSVSCNDLGNLHSSKGEYNKAVEYYKKTLDIMVKNLGEHHMNLEPIHYNLGFSYAALGEFENAVKQYEKSLSIQRKSENKTAFLDTLNLAKDAYVQLGNNLKAVSVLEEAVSFIQKSCRTLSVEEARLSVINNIHFFKELQSLYIKTGQPHKAAEISQRISLYSASEGSGRNLKKSSFPAVFDIRKK